MYRYILCRILLTIIGLATPDTFYLPLQNASPRVPTDLSIVDTLLTLTLERSGEGGDGEGAVSELRILSRLVRSVVAAAAASVPVVDVCGFGYTSTDTATSNLVGMSAVILAKVVAVLDGGGAMLESAATAAFVRAVVLPLLGAMAATWMQIPDGQDRPEAQWRAPDASLVRAVADVALRSAAQPRESAPPWCDTLTAVAANLLGKCVVQLVCIYEPVAARRGGATAAPMLSSDAEEAMGRREEAEAGREATGTWARLLLAPASAAAVAAVYPDNGSILLRALRRAVAPRRAIERRAVASGGSALVAAENALAAALIWHSGLLPQLNFMSENSATLLRGGSSAAAEKESKIDGVEAEEKTQHSAASEDGESQDALSLDACFVPLAAAFRKAALALRSWSAREARLRTATQAELCADAEKRAMMLLLLPCETPRDAWATGVWKSSAPGERPRGGARPGAALPLHVPRKQGALRTLLREEGGFI